MGFERNSPMNAGTMFSVPSRAFSAPAALLYTCSPAQHLPPPLLVTTRTGGAIQLMNRHHAIMRLFLRST